MTRLNPSPELYGLPYAIPDVFRQMPWRRLGSSGLKASAIGLGTWRFGLPETGDGSRVGERDAMAIFDRSAELGVTFWDTANRYNDSSGNSERLIGRWIRRNPAARRDLVLATKVCGLMDGWTPNHQGLSRSAILDAVAASLERMQVDYIDVLYFHQPDPGVALEESLAAVEDLIRGGSVRYLAVSNFTVDQLDELFRLTAQVPGRRLHPVAVQNRFDLVRGESSGHPGVLKFCQEHQLSYIAWSPLGEGLLAGKANDLNAPGLPPRLRQAAEQAASKDPDFFTKLQKLGALASRLGVSQVRLVLAAILRLPGMGPQIPSASSIAQLEDNAAAASLDLSGSTGEALDQLLADSGIQV